MNTKSQLLGAYSGVIFLLFFAVGMVPLADFLPVTLLMTPMGLQADGSGMTFFPCC